MTSKLKDLFERYERDGYPSRLQIQQDMWEACAAEPVDYFKNGCPHWSEDNGCMMTRKTTGAPCGRPHCLAPVPGAPSFITLSLISEIERFIEHRISHAVEIGRAEHALIYPQEIKAILERHK